MKSLVRYLKKEKITPQDLSYELQCSTAAVYTWMRGFRKPRVDTAIKLEELTKGKVSVYDWK